MREKTTIEVIFSLTKKEMYSDFSLSTVTDRLGILPTRTMKKGEWMNESTRTRKREETRWIYRTGRVETLDFEMMLKRIVNTFKDKVDIINDLKRELQVEPKPTVIVNVVEGQSPGYLIESEVMAFAMSIGVEIEIDPYISPFEEKEWYKDE